MAARELRSATARSDAVRCSRACGLAVFACDPYGLCPCRVNCRYHNFFFDFRLQGCGDWLSTHQDPLNLSTLPPNPGPSRSLNPPRRSDLSSTIDRIQGCQNRKATETRPEIAGKAISRQSSLFQTTFPKGWGATFRRWVSLAYTVGTSTSRCDAKTKRGKSNGLGGLGEAAFFELVRVGVENVCGTGGVVRLTALGDGPVSATVESGSGLLLFHRGGVRWHG